jgi:hypothetical protein
MSPSPNLIHGRHPERAVTEADITREVIDSERICHVAFVVDGWPYAVPTIHARDGDRLLIHGSTLSRMLGTLAAGVRHHHRCRWHRVRPFGLPPLDELPVGDGVRDRDAHPRPRCCITFLGGKRMQRVTSPPGYRRLGVCHNPTPCRMITGTLPPWSGAWPVTTSCP